MPEQPPLRRNQSRVESDAGQYGIIPEWILYAEISPLAKIAWVALKRHDGPVGCIVTRNYIADKLGCSAKTFDRAFEELQGIGAGKKQKRVDETGQRSNLYQLFSVPPERRGVYPRVGRGMDTSDQTPLDTSDQGALDTGGDAFLITESYEVLKEAGAAPPDKPAAVDDQTPPKEQPAKSKPKKPPTWAATMHPTVLKICPTAEQKDVFALLNKLKKTYPQATIEAALGQVLEEGTELGVRSMWPVITNTCKRITDAHVINRPKGRQAPVSNGNTRGRGAYGKKGQQ